MHGEDPTIRGPDRTPRASASPSRSDSRAIEAAARDKKATDLTRARSPEDRRVHRLLPDLHGREPRQVHAIADAIEQALKAQKVRPAHVEGYQRAEWVLRRLLRLHRPRLLARTRGSSTASNGCGATRRASNTRRGATAGIDYRRGLQSTRRGRRLAVIRSRAADSSTSLARHGDCDRSAVRRRAARVARPSVSTARVCAALLARRRAASTAAALSRVCGDPLPSWRVASVAQGLCPRCRRGARVIASSRAIGAYDGTLRDDHPRAEVRRPPFGRPARCRG